MADEDLIRIICPFDRTLEVSERSKKIICAQKREFISQDFPRDRLWGYCCACQSFWPLTTNGDGEVEEQCPACGRTFRRDTARLCTTCEVLSLQALERPKDRPNKVRTVTSEGAKVPVCAGCLSPVGASEARHSCGKADVAFTTSRDGCPFCQQSIEQTAEGEAVAGTDVLLTEEDSGGEAAPGGPPDSEAVVVQDAVPDAVNGRARRRAPGRAAKLLPRTGAQWATAIGLVLTALGVVLTLFPPPILLWYCHRYISHRAPVVQPLSFSQREVLESQKIVFKAEVEDHDRLPVKCQWSTTAGRLDENNCEAVLDTAGVSPQAVPMLIKVGVRATDSYDLSASGEAEVYVVPVTMVNKPPILEAVRPSTQEVRSGDQVSLFAFTRNPDNDKLTYTWNSSSGQIVGTGETAILNTSGVSPQVITPITVTLQVDDGRGGAVTGSVTVNVLPAAVKGELKLPSPTPPVVTNNKSPKLLSLQPQKSTVLAGESVGIDAVANDEDQDRLDYIWEPADRIAGSGASVTLKTLADDSKGEVKPIQVRLTVIDRRGGSASQLVFVYVLPQPKTASPPPAAAPPTKPEEAKGGAPAERPL